TTRHTRATRAAVRPGRCTRSPGSKSAVGENWDRNGGDGGYAHVRQVAEVVLQGAPRVVRAAESRNEGYPHRVVGDPGPGKDPHGLPPLHAALLALHFAWYNLVRIHRTLRVTPAMAAGVTERVWELNELVH